MRYKLAAVRLLDAVQKPRPKVDAVEDVVQRYVIRQAIQQSLDLVLRGRHLQGLSDREERPPSPTALTAPMAADHLPGCDTHHTDRQSCNGSGASIQSSKDNPNPQTKQATAYFFESHWYDPLPVRLGFALLVSYALTFLTRGFDWGLVPIFLLVVAGFFAWEQLTRSWRISAGITVDGSRSTLGKGTLGKWPVYVNHSDLRFARREGERAVVVGFVDRSVLARGSMAERRINMRTPGDADGLVRELQHRIALQSLPPQA